MLSVSLSSAPQNTKSFHSLFLPKTSYTHTPRSPMTSQNSSKDDVDFVLNCTKRVLSIFQNFKFHNELCNECIGFVEQAIKILEESKNLSNNKRSKLIESNEYNHFNNLIFDIEFYLKKYDQRTAIQSEVKESIQDFVFNLENCVNTLQQVYETEKSKKTNGWNPSVISKVKTIGRLMNLTKDPEPQVKENACDKENNCDNENTCDKENTCDNENTCDTCDKEHNVNEFFSCEEENNPNRLIIQPELIISTGIHRGTNNIRKGNFISEEVAEKYIGSISKKSDEFTKFQKEVFYVKKLSRGCKNILSVNGYLERNGRLWVVEEWAEYNLLDYLRNNLNLNWKIKLAIARGIANALNYVHNLNLLHYNVKINSILLNRGLEPKLHKFGKDENDCVFLKSFQSLRPSNWSAPEVKRNEEYTSASEVYNFGVVLWEIATQDFKSENEFDVDAPTNYLTLMKKALSNEPYNRPTMQEMFDSLYQLESSYNARYQKKLLSTRNITTNTSSIVSNSSNSSEDSPTLINESASCTTSRVNSPTPSSPSISDEDHHTTNEINDIADIEKAIKFHENRQYSKAFKLFNEYNKQNPSSGTVKYWIGLYYYKGYHKLSNSSKQSIKLSLKYFGEAARLNHPDAQYYYSRVLLNNPSTDCGENRFQIAIEFLKKSSDQNHLPSMRWLGKIMGKGEFGCKKDIETSKMLTDRSRRLSRNSIESRNTLNVSVSTTPFKGKKTRTLSNTSTISRPVTTYKSVSNQSKRDSTVFGNTVTVKNKNRHSTLF